VGVFQPSDAKLRGCIYLGFGKMYGVIFVFALELTSWMQCMKKKKNDSVKDVLCQVFEFTEADIAANRDGELSEAQKQRMERKHLDDSRMAWIGLLIFAVIGFFGSTAAAVNEGIPLLQMWVGLTITIVCTGVWPFEQPKKEDQWLLCFIGDGRRSAIS
jgi:hypothetical protein